MFREAARNRGGAERRADAKLKGAARGKGRRVGPEPPRNDGGQKRLFCDAVISGYSRYFRQESVEARRASAIGQMGRGRRNGEKQGPLRHENEGE